MIPFLAPRFFIDELRRREAEALVEIHAGAFPHPWSADDFRALIAERSVFVLAARRQSLLGFRRLVGFALVRQAADEAEILTIAVRAADRGRGIGRLLMEEALRRLYRDRVASCFLEVDRDNAAAVGLYRSLGFQAVGERKGYYHRQSGEAGGALVMRLQLR
jgi:ribosomal-protein-alanine N-acetyltransferase